MLDANESDLGGYKDVTVAVKAKGVARAGRGAVGAAEVRGRRAPRAAGAGHRVPGARPHLRGRRAGAARGRAGRRHDRRERPAHRRLPLLAAPAASRSTPPTPRSGSRTCPPGSSSAARTRRASCRTASRRCASCAPGCSPPPRRPPTPRPPTPAAAQVRTVDRSERIRTYNFPENRISDHRTGYKAYNLDQVLDGDLDAVLDSLRRGGPGGPARAARAAKSRGGDEPRSLLTPAATATLRCRRRWPAPTPTRRSCSRTCSASRAAGWRSSTTSTPTSAPGSTTSLVARRARREPLQHLTGTAAFRHVELAVGPGVFVPRPETELLAGWAIEQARRLAGRRSRGRPLHRLRGDRARPGRTSSPGASVHAVELDEERATPGRASQPRPAPGSTCGRATWPTRLPRPRRHRRPGDVQPALHPARRLRVGGARGARPRPARSRCSRATTAWTRSGPGARRAPAAAARWSGRCRARRRAGRVRAGGLPRARTLGRRTRPPGPGRSATLRDRPTGTMTSVTHPFNHALRPCLRGDHA